MLYYKGLCQYIRLEFTIVAEFVKDKHFFRINEEHGESLS